MVDRRTAPPARPALDIRLPALATSLLPRLDALLDDHDPFAVEDAGFHGESAREEGAPPAPVERRVYFFSADSRDAARRAIDRILGPDGARTLPIDIPDDGQAARSHASLRAVRVGRVVVAPPWDAPAPPDDHHDGSVVVIIEPSMGFGTGHHASTRLCLQALQRLRDRLQTSHRVLDLGTGSGVLAIAAALLGARRTVAVERDPDALGNALDNIRRNRVEDRVTTLAGDLAEAAPAPGDIVVANLAGAFFRQHAARVLGCVRAGGVLLAGGITNDEEQAVRAAFAPPLTLRERTAEDEWVGLAFERPAGANSPRTAA